MNDVTRFAGKCRECGFEIEAKAPPGLLIGDNTTWCMTSKCGARITLHKKEPSFPTTGKSLDGPGGGNAEVTVFEGSVISPEEVNRRAAAGVHPAVIRALEYLIPSRLDKDGIAEISIVDMSNTCRSIIDEKESLGEVLVCINEQKAISAACRLAGWSAMWDRDERGGEALRLYLS